MAIVRMNPNPVRLSNNLFNDFDRLFSDLASRSTVANEPLSYPADLYETNNHIVLEMAVPGLTAENLDISVEDRNLVIKGKFPEEKSEENQDRRYWMQSISRSEFSRSLKLARSVDVDNIAATVENGMLKLEMPKVAEAKVRKIEIS